MFLAPLNYDKYFNKVFSNERIAKRFLEDFLETEVNELEMLKGKLRVTDNASLVEFDFRCKIDNSFVILDMQQWYKRDISQRFYLYHALNTGLQLEKLPSKRVLYDYSYEKNKKVEDYRALLPVLTLVWMADDSLDLKDDYVAYSMSPEIVVKFVKNKKLWHKPEIVELLKERARLLEVLDNQTKELQFLAKNRLIFMLQKNTVKNKNNAKYVKWFEFAEKTKNTDNKKEDFQEYLDDEIFCEMMKRLSKDTLTDDDFSYIQNEKTFWEEVERFEQGIYEVAWNEGEKNKALEIAKRLKEKGFDDDLIAAISGLSTDEITRL
jgi:hypothetical protein